MWEVKAGAVVESLGAATESLSWKKDSSGIDVCQKSEEHTARRS